MSISINTITPNAIHVWGACVQLIAATVCCAFVWVVLKSVPVIYYAIGTPTNPATDRAKTQLRRGKTNNAEHSPIIPPFHPNAPAHPQDVSLLELALRFLDEILDRLATFGPTLFGMVSPPEILQRLTHINHVRGPLNSRLNRGIAQVLTLRDQVVAHRTVVFRYLFPTTFLCCLLIGLGAVVNVSIESIILAGSGALVLAVADESNFAPVRARAGLLETLFEWVGVW
ncbi:hypothetical protein ACGC1H_005546 [Rhizoctonia solani]|uniref:Uncharacterized protein n=1 Tax=Rhizoctonia solani TaxID=456999 RepID=A0A8H3GGT6_9AGAM|nr:unnamed protein product [Rhizoctonia solani]